jgi:ribose/xylose/arabinose/galactoside ABC-type transport system permease subunit
VTTTNAPTDRRMMLARAVLAALGVLAFVVFSVALAHFLSVENMIDLLNDVAVVGIVALPATFLIMSGQLDLSVGGTAALVGIISAATAPGLGAVSAVLLGAGAGVLIGLGNGLMVTAARVDSIPATFASMALLRGLAYLVAGGLTISLAGFRSLGTAEPVAGLSVSTLIFGALAVTAGALSRSAVGRRCRDVGLLPAAERCDGRRERRRLLALFAVSGFAAGLVGLIVAARLGAGSPTAALGLELTVVASVLLGGGRLAGGHGSVGGTLLAVLFICVIDNGFALANVTPFAGPVVAAALLIVALVIDRPRRPRQLPHSPDEPSRRGKHDPARGNALP